MGFRRGQLIRPKGIGKNQDLFEVVHMDAKYIQAINIKANAHISFPRVSSNTYRLASDADIRSFISRYLKYNMIRNWSSGGKWAVGEDYIAGL